ncbi:aspartate aminotransferase family protein [Nocardioides sp. Y6]|uniref:Aspartate aminotransferase family protein n=1 Tax=Nocardioides malaquae TaxID=2773426 RepID=A0ABR9RTW8_9ACTN|nr:aminotransferase class V-fold PLP-dependent enzyme [Nocardioides malaquae]MBE7325030.1 aspartate aminotransferase family protein [Nocardioides malaquae]
MTHGAGEVSTAHAATTSWSALQAGETLIDGTHALNVPGQRGRDAGVDEVEQVGRDALAAYAGAFGAETTTFPTVVAMENDVVGWVADLLHAPPEAVGTVTADLAEAVMLAVLAARDSRPEVISPSIVVPETVHPEFHQAAHHLGVRTMVVPVGEDQRPDPVAMVRAMDATTVLVVVSAPSHAHGVVDPVAAIAEGARVRRVRCHVDAGVGGWALPYAESAGRDVPLWDFRVAGVTSVSLDTHPHAPEGTALLVHRSDRIRHHQFYASARWPGATMLNTTMLSTRSPAPLAGLWAVVTRVSPQRQRRCADHALEAMDRVVAGVREIPQLHVAATPDSTLVAIGCDDTMDVFTLRDELVSRDWSVKPQMSFRGRPPTLHLAVGANSLPVVDRFLLDLEESVAAAVAAGPVVVDPGVLEVVDSLNPRAMGPAEFDAVLAAAGLPTDPGGAVVLPERMARVNAVLDRASPVVREALLVAFLERLARPVRAAAPTPVAPAPPGSPT